MNKKVLFVGLATFLAIGAGIALPLIRGHLNSKSPAPVVAVPVIAPGPIDVGFAQSMLVHHAQAVLMAQIVQIQGGRGDLGKFAKTIETSQLLEMGQMQGWLALWDKPVIAAPPSMEWMLLGPQPPDADVLQFVSVCRSSPEGMPGLATPVELDELRKKKGPQLEARFMELMIAHHQSAIPMAEFARKNAQVPVVRMLAQRMVAVQTEEIAHMTGHLAHK